METMMRKLVLTVCATFVLATPSAAQFYPPLGPLAAVPTPSVPVYGYRYGGYNAGTAAAIGAGAGVVGGIIGGAIASGSAIQPVADLPPPPPPVAEVPPPPPIRETVIVPRRRPYGVSCPVGMVPVPQALYNQWGQWVGTRTLCY